MRNAIRIKHYAYSTERTYIDWIKRFIYYVQKTLDRDVFLKDITSDKVKDYLTYLAVNKRVAASTQNQAFNALIFLFREVLKSDIGEIQQLLGHKNIETTMTYTHVLRDITKVPQSPLDTLKE